MCSWFLVVMLRRSISVGIIFAGATLLDVSWARDDYRTKRQLGRCNYCHDSRGRLASDDDDVEF